MSATSSSLDRRGFLASSAAVATSGLFVTAAEAAAEDGAIRPFRIDIAEEQLADLRRRLAATRWPDKETVADDSQGVPSATIQDLARYWGKDYDWRKVEARLNALPQFVTEIDGVDIHFIHVRSNDIMRCRSSSPRMASSVIEQLNHDPLTNPTANGASASDAFHLRL